MKGRIYQREFKGGKVWAIDYTEPSGRRIREVIGTNKLLAQEVLASRLGDLARGKYQLRVKVGVRFRDFRAEYLEAVKAAGRRFKNHAQSLRALEPFFGDMRLDKISAADIAQYRTERQKSVKDSTINRALACLRSMFNAAKERHRVSGENPVGKRAIVKERPKVKHIFTAEERAAFLGSFGHKAGHARLAAIIALNTGFRLTEILTLRWADIDFEGGFLTTERRKDGLPFKVLMTPTLRAELRRAPRRGPFVFPGQGDASQPMRSIKRAVKTAVAKAAAKYPAMAGVTFHTLRANAGQAIIDAGLSPIVAQMQLGHKDIRTTMRYLQVTPDMMKLGAEAMERKNARKNGTDSALEPFRPSKESAVNH